jgi:hypothetical protein
VRLARRRLAAERRTALRAPDRGPERLRAVLGERRLHCLLAPDHIDRRREREPRRRARPAVAAHQWLARATSCCLAAIDALEAAPAAYELAFAIRFVDSVHGREPAAPALLERLAEYVPKDGRLRVAGGLADETLWPLDLAPEPGRPARTILDEAAVASDLERLAGEQNEDGGWTVDFQSYSPAAALEWNGYATVRAVSVLRDNGVIEAPLSPSGGR